METLNRVKLYVHDRLDDLDVIVGEQRKKREEKTEFVLSSIHTTHIRPQKCIVKSTTQKHTAKILEDLGMLGG